nr:TIM barrel protein [Paenibacillus larvae]
MDWIEAIDQRNVGLLLDTFHWYTNKETEEDLLKLRPDLIVHVHLNDVPDVPVEEVKDNERLYPGEGVIPLSLFLAAFRRSAIKGLFPRKY